MKPSMQRMIEELEELDEKKRLDRQRIGAAIARVRRYIAAREASDWEPKDFVDKEGSAELSLADLIEIVGKD